MEFGNGNGKHGMETTRISGKGKLKGCEMLEREGEALHTLERLDNTVKLGEYSTVSTNSNFGWHKMSCKL